MTDLSNSCVVLLFGNSTPWIILTGTLSIVILGLILSIIKIRQRDNVKIEEYKALADKARKTLEEREKFLAYTNHEIRTPLNAVSGSAELLGKTQLSAKQSKYVKTIKASVDNVLVLVNDVLDLSRIESGNIEFRKDDFLLSDVLLAINYILNEKVEQKGIQFVINLDDNIPSVVNGDSRCLNQILINLCNNAVKFTDLGKVELNAQLIEYREDKYHIKFEVKDTGKGIRKSKISTIFNQFEQETRHTIKHKGGSGLGLAITKQLVESMGGQINLESKYLEGTTFNVVLAFEKGTKSVKKKGDTDTSILDDMKIVVVDDNHLNREIVEDVLTNLNPKVHVFSFENGEDTIEYFSQNQADLVLMDIQMPVMDGYELTQYIRQNIRKPMNDVPIIAMTAYAMDNVAEMCFKVGMNDYITKPISWPFLLAKIERFKEKSAPKKSEELRFDAIDLGNLKRLTAGDNNKMYKYIDIFLENVPKDIQAMRNSMKEDDCQMALDMLHKIKGNAVYMGNHEVGYIYDNLSKMENLSDHEHSFEEAALIADQCVKEIKIVKKNYKLLFLEIK